MTTIEDDITQNIDYKTFIKIINNIPSCIFYKDTELRYQFSSHCWEQLISDDIIGKTDLEIRKDKENAAMAMELDKNIIRSGKGCSYVIKSEIDDHVSYLELIKEPVFDDKGEVIGIVGLINDVTEKTVLEMKIKELNTTDTLTKVMNRRAGTESISLIIEVDKLNKVFCLLDLNGFKHINDVYGHQMGDNVLREFGYALRRSVYDTDVVMRLGGDEFIVLLNDIDDIKKVEAFVDKLHENMSKMLIQGFEEEITVSIGAKRVEEDSTFDSLYVQTDKLMYEAKKQSEGHFVISK